MTKLGLIACPFILLSGVAFGAPTVTVTKVSSSYDKCKVLTLGVDATINATASSQYQVKVVATAAGACPITLVLAAQITTDCSGKFMYQYSGDPAGFVAGTKYTFTVYLFAKGADTTKNNLALASGSKDYTIPKACNCSPPPEDSEVEYEFGVLPNMPNNPDQSQSENRQAD